MPDLSVVGLVETAVLWMAEVEPNAYGETVISDEAQEVPVSWDPTKRVVHNPRGGELAIDASAGVDRFIREGSLMWLGRVQDLPPGTGFFEELQNVMRVVIYKERKDLKGRHTRRVVHLARFKDSR